MWQEVYYEQYTGYGSGGERILPYSIKCRSDREKEALEALFRKDGFRCVGGSQCLGLLVNLRLKRYCSYPKPASMSCVRGYSYPAESFLQGIYLPWIMYSEHGIEPEQMRAFQSTRLQSFIRCERNQGLAGGEILEKLSAFA